MWKIVVKKTGFRSESDKIRRDRVLFFHTKGVIDIMIEIVYEKEKQKPEGNEEFFRIPNNIRQIGEIQGTWKIYIEDYAYTYLSRISLENSCKGIAAILLGQVNWRNGNSYLFVKSAVLLSDMEVSEEHLVFTQEIWNHVYEKNKEFFRDQEIIGWFLSIPGCSMELHEVICRTHLDHFGGSDKVLLVMEPLEKEEAFYRYEEGKMSRQTGFYVYYEQNEPMCNYLVSRNERMEKKSEDVDDSAVHTFRKKVEDKVIKNSKKQPFPITKMASVCAAAAVLAVGVLYLNDYQKLKSGREVMEELGRERVQKAEEKVLPVNGTADAKEEINHQTEKTKPERLPEKDDKKEPVNENETETTGAEIHPSYTIQPGDTITKISIRNYGDIRKIKEICELNQISEKDLIYPGQKILLP